MFTFSTLSDGLVSTFARVGIGPVCLGACTMFFMLSISVPVTGLTPLYSPLQANTADLSS